MANSTSLERALADPDLARSDDLALEVPSQEAPGADEVDSAALSLAVDDSADDDCDPPEDYRDYGDWKQQYADSVGMPLYEKIR